MSLEYDTQEMFDLFLVFLLNSIESRITLSTIPGDSLTRPPLLGIPFEA
jgi:hypothetical protein